MAKFLRLTAPDGAVLCVNMRHVVLIRALSTGMTGARLFVAANASYDCIDVAETLDAIVAMLESR